MYKIYINENLLLLGTREQFESMQERPSGLPYFGKSKSILNIVDRFEKVTNAADFFLYTSDLDLLWQDFQDLFKNISASGGLVQDSDGNLLFIYRNDIWDLPKGKAEKGESRPATAMREVAEETGLEPSIDSFSTTTYHTYRNRKKKRVLKHTHWYHMSVDSTDLALQKEEGIEDAKWIMPKADESWMPRPLYRSLAEMLAETALLRSSQGI